MPKIISFRKWRIGAFVSIVTGLATAFAVGVIVPTMTLKEGVFICLASIAKDFLLYQKQHPIEDVELDSVPQTETQNQKET